MKIDINIRTVGMVCLGTMVGLLMWTAWSRSTSSSRCERSCGKLKSQMIEGSCHCNTAAGWTPAKSASWIDRKVTGRK